MNRAMETERTHKELIDAAKAAMIEIRDSMDVGETRRIPVSELKGMMYLRGVDRPLTRARFARVPGLLFEPGKPAWTFVRVS